MFHLEMGLEVGWGSSNGFATRQSNLLLAMTFLGDDATVDGLNGDTDADLFVMNGEDRVFRVLAEDLRFDL